MTVYMFFNSKFDTKRKSLKYQYFALFYFHVIIWVDSLGNTIIINNHFICEMDCLTNYKNVHYNIFWTRLLLIVFFIFIDRSVSLGNIFSN